jgi:hypothetical protein
MACLPQPDDLRSLVLRTDFSDDRPGRRCKRQSRALTSSVVRPMSAIVRTRAWVSKRWSTWMPLPATMRS